LGRWIIKNIIAGALINSLKHELESHGIDSSWISSSLGIPFNARQTSGFDDLQYDEIPPTPDLSVYPNTLLPSGWILPRGSLKPIRDHWFIGPVQPLPDKWWNMGSEIGPVQSLPDKQRGSGSQICPFPAR
jgi:hypothetical protein